MSAGREQHDSDGSWTWVDNEEDNFRKRAEKRRVSSYERAEIEEVHDAPDYQDEAAQESDISILTDPEDHPEASAEYVEEGTPLGSNDLEKAKAHFKEMAAEMQTAAKVKAALDVAKPGECELAVTERRVRSYLRSTLASAGFMIGGLLIAAYCQWGCDSNYSSPIQEYYDRPYDDPSVDIVEDYGRGRYNKKHDSHKDNLKYAAQTHKNAKEKYRRENEMHGQHGKRRHDDDLPEREHFDKKQKKGDYKHKDKHYDDHDSHEHKGKHAKKGKKKNDIHEDKENYKPKEKKHEKYQEHMNTKHDVKNKHEKHEEHENYLYKKEAYLKQKENKLKQKEYKLHAKYTSNEKYNKKDRHDKKEKKHKEKLNRHNQTSSGEWYENMHKGRKDKRRQDEQADWMFERAQGRDKKRDKATWYFDMMDERETNRVKKS